MDLDYLQALMGGTLAETPADSYRDIWVIAETRQSRLAQVTRELLGRARELADLLGVHVATVLIGHNTSGLAGEAVAHGSDVVYILDDALLADYRTETYVKPLASLIEEKKPEIVIMGATARGRDLAPRLATRLKTGLISECVALDVDETERLLLGTRPTYGGMLLTTVACPKARPQMATALPGCFHALPPDHNREGTVEDIAVSVTEADIVGRFEPTQAAQPKMSVTDAPVIVAGGRGIAGSEGFTQLEELAMLLGGTVAASHSAVEFGWAPREHMVDITANHVHPDLYIAVGISGAFPHRMATRGTRCLVAINTDARAPIFRQADYGIIGDWREVIPELIHAVKEAKTQ